jgi:LacI family transcriptional regulator
MPRTPIPPAKPVTIMDVAEGAQVSKSTVSLVLQDSPLIREETAARVREVAAQLGYVYNRRAADLRRKSSNTVGVIINDLLNPFFAELLVGIERRLVQAGYIALMAHTNESLALQNQVLQSMREHHAAGIVLCPALGTTRQLIKQVQSWGIPLLVTVRPLGPGSYDFAGSDNEKGTRLATEHLIAAGHKRIGFIGGQTGLVYEQRVGGYRKALADAGLAQDERLVVPAHPTRQGGYEATLELLARKPRCTAAVCYNDVAAFGALAALGEKGMRAGSDFALVGFDNVLDAAHSNPPLSTVDITPSALGERAAELLLARIADPGRSKQTYLGEPHLLLRQSG